MSNTIESGIINDAVSKNFENCIAQVDVLQFSPRLIPETWTKIQEFINKWFVPKTDFFELKEYHIEKDTDKNVIVFYCKRPEAGTSPCCSRFLQ